MAGRAKAKAKSKAKTTEKTTTQKSSKPKPKPKSKSKSKLKPKPVKRGAHKAPRVVVSATATATTTGAQRLGEITVPSGTLAVFDVGLIGYLPREALEPALVTTQVPADRPLPVIGHRVGVGRFADCWDHVAVELGDFGSDQPATLITHAKKLGEAGVDFARLVCMDHRALDHWKHEDSLDGRADFVFWGRDAAALAKAIGAPSIKEGHGWTNLPIAEAEAKADKAERIKAERRWLLATDYRPHSHHFHALAAARKSPHGAGTIDVAGAKVCLFFTSWGDGVFPIYLDLDHDDRPVRLRVQLNTDASNAAMHEVNR
jgi:hypothetical protein